MRWVLECEICKHKLAFRTEPKQAVLERIQSAGVHLVCHSVRAIDSSQCEKLFPRLQGLCALFGIGAFRKGHERATAMARAW